MKLAEETYGKMEELKDVKTYPGPVKYCFSEVENYQGRCTEGVCSGNHCTATLFLFFRAIHETKSRMKRTNVGKKR